ncbi:MAG: hypothetical protein IPM14_13165 [bacterium]|nr:hypothetical protein [bacterium]
MEKKFILPAATFLAGVIIWLYFFFFGGTDQQVVWVDLTFGIVIGGLIVISAFACRRAEGPKSGSIFRSGILLIMALLTFWKIGISAAIILLSAFVITLLIALNTKQIKPSAS